MSEYNDLAQAKRAILDNLEKARQSLRSLQENGQTLQRSLNDLAHSLLNSVRPPLAARAALGFSNAELRLELSCHVEAFLGHIARHLQELVEVSDNIDALIDSACRDPEIACLALLGCLARIQGQKDVSRDYVDLAILLTNTIHLSNCILRIQLHGETARPEAGKRLPGLQAASADEQANALLASMQDTDRRVRQLFFVLESDGTPSMPALELEAIGSALDHVFTQIGTGRHPAGLLRN